MNFLPVLSVIYFCHFDIRVDVGIRPILYAYAIMLYAYAYCLDAIDIMTKTSDKYDWYVSIVLPLIYHGDQAYKGMGRSQALPVFLLVPWGSY